MRKLLFFAIGLAVGLATWFVTARVSSDHAMVFAQDLERSTAPHYDSHGALLRPQNFETWVFVGSSTGLTYEPGMQGSGVGEFHDVYIRPESYREYLRTGKFPEETVLVLALYPPEDKISPAKGGYFEGDLDGMAAAVKDHSHFAEGWAYFNFGRTPNLQAAATANPQQNCYACHVKHGADDNVFVQFYPVLRPIMNAHHHAAQ
jgi:Cytochrome P460